MTFRASRAALAWLLVALPLFGLWMLLVDTHEDPQVYAGLAVAALGATGSELVRRQRVAGARLRLGWLRRSYRPPLSAAPGLLRLARVAVAALPPGGRRARGRLRAIPFAAGGGAAETAGREALAELAGSFSPNTFVVGLDRERGLLLVHQLVPEESRPQESID